MFVVEFGQSTKHQGQNMANNVKIVIVGDGSVGKTSLCNVFVNQSFPTNHDATVFENFSQELYVCGQVWPNNLTGKDFHS